VHSGFKAGPVSVEDDESFGKKQLFKKFENSSTKTATEQSVSSHTLFRSVMGFTRS
jgi:hypothetical protein